MTKQFKGRVIGDQYMPVTDASLTGYGNTALPGSSNVEQALDTMILNINSTIIESGSNNNGRYTKYADGSMVQYGNAEAKANEQRATATFPIQFLNTPRVYATATFYNEAFCSATVGTTTSAYTDIYIDGKNEGTTSTRGCNWFALGHWKAPSSEPYKPVLPEFPSDIVTYDNASYHNLENAKQAFDYLLNDEEYHIIEDSEWLNGMKTNGLSFWHRRGKLLTLNLCCRYPNPGTKGTIIYKLPFKFLGASFMYNSFQAQAGPSNGVVGIYESGDVIIIDTIAPESNLNFIITNIIK